MPVLNPTREELKNERLKQIDIEISMQKPANKYQEMKLNEMKATEFPNAPVVSQNLLVNDEQFYADEAIEKNKSKNIDVNLHDLFRKYGTPKYVAEIVSGIKKRLLASEITFLSENFGIVEKQIKENLTKSTSVEYFVDFVVNVIQTKKTSYNSNTKLSEMKLKLRKLIKENIRDGYTIKSWDGNTILFEGLTNTQARGKAVLDLTKKIRAMDSTNGPIIIDTIVQNLLNAQPNTISFTPAPLTPAPAASTTTTNLTPVPITGLGFKKKTKKPRPLNLKLITGSGVKIINETDKVTKHKKITDNKQFYGMNKFIIDEDKFEDDNVIELRYSLNYKKVRDIVIPNEKIKSMIKDIFLEKFDLKKFNKLTKDNKSFITKFADKCHVHLEGVQPNHEEEELNYKIYKGELDAGNPEPLLQFLIKSHYDGRLGKTEFYEAIKELVK